MATSEITHVSAREIIDSRGNPTIEVTCELSGGARARASVPSGASTGTHEAHELRDHDPKRFNGLGVLTAVKNVNEEISMHILHKAFDQASLDRTLRELDGTENKSRLGANAVLGTSLAFARAKSKEEGGWLYAYLGALANNREYRLPQPFFNIINGGKHADSGLDIQEYLIAPVGPTSMREKIRCAAEIIAALRTNLGARGYAVSVGDEGGFAPRLSSNEEAIERILEAVDTAGYSTESVKIGIDAAATSFYHDNAYQLKIHGEERSMSSADLIDWYEELASKYPLISIEDGLAEEDWEGFSRMTARLGGTLQIVGDDLLVTNVARIERAAKERAVNSVLIKPNQIGTLSETIEAIQLTKKQGWTPFVSHRSGETTDTFIADLAVGLSCAYLKSGALVRGERVCKYNRLMEIEEHLGV